MASFECFEKSKQFTFCQPKYPKFMYMNTINKLKHRNKCLDIGVGVGQLLFPLVPYFKSLKGIDTDEKTLETTRHKLMEMDNVTKQKISLQNQNVLKLCNNEKYDLITIGQTLHELPIKETLKILKNHLEPNGKLLIINYYLNNVQFKTKQCLITTSYDSNQDMTFKEFYQKVKPYSDFDEQILHKTQQNTQTDAFEQFFPTVRKQIAQIPIQMCPLSYLEYLKSYSGLKKYILKNRSNPLAAIQQGCKGKRKCNFDFISIECSTD